LDINGTARRRVETSAGSLLLSRHHKAGNRPRWRFVPSEASSARIVNGIRSFSARKRGPFKGNVCNWPSLAFYEGHAVGEGTPVRYWIQIGLQMIFLVGCFFVAIFGWQSNT
jgi:hypothetical protein